MSILEITKVYKTFKIDTLNLKVLIEKLYNLKIFGELECINSGFVNVNLKFQSDKGAYIVRLFGKISEFTDTELEIQFLLSQKGLIVPQCLKDNKNKLINKFNEDYFSLFKFIEGNEPSLIPTTLFRIGNLVGETQNLLKELDLKIDRLSWIERKFNDRLKTLKFIEENITTLKQVLSKNDFELVNDLIKFTQQLKWETKNISKQILHADIYKPNMLDNGKQIALLDFEAVSFGPKMLDLMTLISWDLLSLDEVNSSDLIFENIKSYLKGYQKYQKVEDPEFCFNLILNINTLVSISNLEKAININQNAFTRYNRYVNNYKFALKNKSKLVNMLGNSY